MAFLDSGAGRDMPTHRPAILYRPAASAHRVRKAWTAEHFELFDAGLRVLAEVGQRVLCRASVLNSV
jgi:hypothetical protein